MASRESMIGVQAHAGAEDGVPGCAPSPEELLARVPSLGGHLDTLGETTSSVSLSMPGSPSGLHQAQVGMAPSPSVHGLSVVPPTETKVDIDHPADPHPPEVDRGAGGEAPVVARSDSTRERDRRFDHFKTFSGRLERQLSALRGVAPLDAADVEHGHRAASNISEEDTDEDNDVPSADRYFAALEGPELETLRARTT
jgi:hypothetical protein